jgi:hypothetical protein
LRILSKWRSRELSYQEFTGIHSDGGYAEMMIAKASGLMSIPDSLSSADAAPLLCAGLTTFNALRNAPAKAGDLVAVLGIGGLGHLGVQYARHMGFEVAAIARGTGTAELAKKLGAHHYIDSAATDPAAALQALGGAKVILITASGGKTVAATFKGLRPGGVSIDVGVGPESMPYGGVGTSGIGNYYGKYGYDSLTHAKSILISPPDVAIDHLFPPYTREKVLNYSEGTSTRNKYFRMRRTPMLRPRRSSTRSGQICNNPSSISVTRRFMRPSMDTLPMSTPARALTSTSVISSWRWLMRAHSGLPPTLKKPSLSLPGRVER